jgi:uroporphyrinogen decarboxylase
LHCKATSIRWRWGRPFVFNLGHGIVPQTPIEHVARLTELVRAG